MFPGGKCTRSRPELQIRIAMSRERRSPHHLAKAGRAAGLMYQGLRQPGIESDGPVGDAVSPAGS